MNPEEPCVPEEVWQRFLQDSEHAIRRTAPKEPSAHERAAAAGLRHEDAQSGGRTEAVGELWYPGEHPALASWRDLDGRARLQHAARLLGVVAALVAILAVVPRQHSDTSPQGPRPGGVVLESEHVPAVPPTVATSASPSGLIPLPK